VLLTIVRADACAGEATKTSRVQDRHDGGVGACREKPLPSPHSRGIESAAMTEQAKTRGLPGGASLAQVCWTRPDGSSVEAAPLPEQLAEAVAQAFERYWPEGTYVVRSIPWLGRPVRGEQ
jgi:hypothetical protein